MEGVRGEWGETGQMGPVGLGREGSGATGGFRRRGSRGMSWVKGESEAPPALAPRGMRTTGQRNDGLG